MSKIRLVFAFVAFLAGSPVVAVPSVPAGNEFQVNSVTTGERSYSSIVTLSTGDFVVAWRDTGNVDGVNIYARQFTLEGAPLGGQFMVNQETDGVMYGPSTARGSDGGFLVVWSRKSELDSVHVRRFDSIGSAIGDEFQVNTYTTGYNSIDRRAAAQGVASDSSGNFVVVWHTDVPGGGGTQDGRDGAGSAVFARRFSSDGSPIGGEFQVNSYTNYHQANASISMAPDGRFIVIWNSGSNNPSVRFRIRGQRFANDGSRLGGEFQINSYTTGSARFPKIAQMQEGDFLVAWQDLGTTQDTTEWNVMGRLFQSDGVPVTNSFQLNTYTTGFQGRPTVAADSEGGFAVVWKSGWFTEADGPDGSYIAVRGRSVTAAGSPGGESEFQVNTYTSGSQSDPSITSVLDGEFVVTWRSYDFYQSSLRGRFLRDIVLFTDGFENGDTASWSRIFP